ncbi:MAG TPA: hypothetical protein P5048_03825, partial [Chlamydiales bacterium]|nr:hypothetical protein [Chlamydiales bacterium]
MVFQMAIVAVPVFSTIVQRGMVLIYKRDRTSFEGKMVYVKKVIDFIHDVFAVDHKMLRPIKFVAKYLFDNICPVSLFVYGLYTLQFPSIYFKITYLALAAIGIEFFNFVIFKFSKKSAYLYGEYNEMLDKSVKDGHCEASYLEENLCEIGFSPMRYISVIFKYLNKDSFDQGCFIRDRRKAFEGNYMDASISEKCIKESGSSPFTREKVSLVYERYVAGEKKYDKKIKKLLKRLKSINGVSFDLGSQSKLYRNPLDFKGKFSDLLKSLKLMPKTREEQLECLQKVSQCIQLIIDENYVFQKFEAYRVFSNSNLENLSKMIESIHEIPQLEEERRSLETIQEAFDRIAHLEGILEGFEEEKACATQRGEPLQFSELQSRILQYDNIGLIDPSVEDIETLKSLIQEHKKDMKQAFKRSVLNIRKKISDFKSYQEMLLISYEVEFYIFCLHRDGILFDKVDSLLEAIQSNSTKIIEELKGSFPPNISEELEEIFHQKRDRVTAFSEENIREMIRQIPQSLEEDLSQNIHKAMHSLNMEIREDLYGIVRGFKGVLPESIMH